MSEQLRSGLIVVAMILMTGLLALLVSTDPAEMDRVQAIGVRVKCPVCQGESIADSPAPMARDMMELVGERVDEGATDSEIIEELLGSYSGAVLLDPPARGSTLLLWLSPPAALAIGAGIIVWWRRHPGKQQVVESTPSTRSKSRLVVGGLVMTAAFALIVVVAADALQSGDGAAAGAAELSQDDLDNISNETMEAVVDANLDHPQINGMRLALAERYYATRNYKSAFPHYLAVAESPTATSPEIVTSLVRLGWMAYDGNGEVEASINLLDEALEIDPDSQSALYIKGQVLWCGAGETHAAAELFRQVLADPDLPPESKSEIEDDLSALQDGAAC